MPTILFPPYERIGNFEAELSALVQAIDNRREQPLPTVEKGFSIYGDYTLSRRFDRYGMSYECAHVAEAQLSKTEVQQALSPILDAALENELRRAKAGTSSEVKWLVTSVLRRIIIPDQAQLKWHSGDARRYIMSLGLVTEFVVGEIELPKDYEPGDWLATNALARGTPDAGDVLRHILATNDNQLPAELELVRPEFGELVRFDRRHAHQAPHNHTDADIDRTRVQIQPSFQK